MILDSNLPVKTMPTICKTIAFRRGAFPQHPIFLTLALLILLATAVRRGAFPQRPSFLTLALLILLATACEMNQYRRGEEMYRQRSFAAAIEEFDAYIETGNNGALRTRAELLRSASYRELALMAIQRQSWQLAIRFGKLANSESADTLLANVYKLLADNSLEAGKLSEGQFYMNLVLEEIPRSRHTPAILFRRINLAMTILGDWNAAWLDYKKLYDLYPGNEYEVQAKPWLVSYSNNRIEYAKTLAETGFFRDALTILFEMARYPVADKDKVHRLISDIYQTQAEIAIAEENYLEADRYFRLAVSAYPENTLIIDTRLSQIAGLFIAKGNEYLALYDFTNARIHYHKAFDIIPDFPAAKDAISRMETVQANIQQAENLAVQANKLDVQKKYAEALLLYREAIQLHNKAEYRQKVAEIQNLMEAERNPTAFAQRIVNDYRNGLLNTRINNVKRNLLVMYKPNEIRDSGWKIMLSTGQYKYEARYDILTPRETYFYLWQINLRDRSIVPLNKISEALMQ